VLPLEGLPLGGGWHIAAIVTLVDGSSRRLIEHQLFPFKARGRPAGGMVKRIGEFQRPDGIVGDGSIMGKRFSLIKTGTSEHNNGFITRDRRLRGIK